MQRLTAAAGHLGRTLSRLRRALRYWRATGRCWSVAWDKAKRH